MWREKMAEIVGNFGGSVSGAETQAKMNPTANMPRAAVSAAARKLVVATLTMTSSPGSHCTMNAPAQLKFASILHNWPVPGVGLVTVD